MQQAAKSAGVLPPRGKSLRVFLVEDFPPLRDLIAENLEEIDGLQLAGVAESEEAALAWLGEHQCDVLILDLELRQGNGLGILKSLTALQADAGIVKIVYSNHASPNIRRLAAQFGASYFFDKTLDTPKLRQLLERLSASHH